MNKLFVGHASIEKANEVSDFLEKSFQIEFIPLELSSKLNKNQLKKIVSQFKIDRKLQYSFYFLIQNFNQWELLDSDLNYLSINFDDDKINYFRKSTGKGDLFIKSIGNRTKSVLDLSCGLAIDTVFLARKGYQVTAIERNPLVYFLLTQAKRLTDDKRVLGIKFVYQQAKDFIIANSISQFDAVYFDPMYPEKKKTALSKQEMELFKNLIGKDEDASHVLELLLKFKTRIVVKRPVHGEAILKNVKQEFVGRSVRYDIY